MQSYNRGDRIIRNCSEGGYPMRNQIDMVHGSLPKKMLAFSVPLILSGLLQLVFNAVDLVVVGRYVGSNALAGVGATSALINLLTNLFLGLSVGSNVLTARYIGAKQDRDCSETVHTSVVISIFAGMILAVIGFIFSKPLLTLMDTPKNVIGNSVLYMRIYFLGMPIMMLYNFGSAILRALGDTRRPLHYLTAAGILNVFLNLFSVLVLKRGVDGVASATVISQLLAAILVLRNLSKQENACRLRLSLLKITGSKLLKITRIGLPAGIQGCIFSLSNVVIQSSVNSFGDIAVAGNSAAMSIEGFVYISMNSFHHTVLSFTGQNYGAGEYKRIPKVLAWGMFFVTFTGLVMGGLVLLLKNYLLGFYIKENVAAAVAFGSKRLLIICSTYFTCGLMDVAVGSLRGLGYSITPTVVSLTGVCGFRLTWIYTYFRTHHTPEALYVSYPISWVVTVSIHLLCFFFIARPMLKKKQALQ